MNTNNRLGNIRIVLVDTQDGANIGSACRAMKTMGITKLALVSDRSYDDERVRTLALHASDIWENSERFTSLSEALRNSIFTVGATRRRGKFRKMSSYSPKQLADIISSLPNGEISIVFGRESDGLTDEEVALCSSVVSIPSSPLFPSLNLSHSVQVICYEIFLSSLPYSPGRTAVSHERVIKASRNIADNLNSIGYFKTHDEEKWTERFLKDVMERASMTESEMKKLEKIFSKTEKIALYKEKDNE